MAGDSNPETGTRARLPERVAQTLSEFASQLTGRGPGAVLVRGAGAAFVLSATGSLIVFGNQVLLARILGAAGYGQYVYVATWVSLLVTVSLAGVNSSALRFVSEYRASGQWSLLRGFVRRGMRIVVATSVAVAVALAAVVGLLRSQLGAGLAEVFWLGCLLLPVWSALELRSACLRGLRRIVVAQGPPLVIRPVMFAMLIAILYLLAPGGVGAATAMAANLGATLVALLVVSLALRAGLEGSRSDFEYRTRTWMEVSFPLLLMTGFGIILRATDTLMLGLLRDTTEAGIYAVASRAAAFVPFMLTAVNTMAAPMISEYFASDDRRRLQRTLTVGVRASVSFALLVAVTLGVAGPSLLRVFGGAFVVAYAPLMILVGAQLLNCGCGSVGYLMTMTGHQRRAAAILGASAAVNIVLNALLIPRFGIVGAAVASALSLISWNTVMVVFVLVRLRLNPTVFSLHDRDVKGEPR